MVPTVTPLHVRSGYSLLRGTTLPERLIERARSLGYARMALTDVNGVYGATGFYRLARQAGIAPILGAELLEQDRAVVALVADEAGYENLCRIITRVHRRLSAVGRGGADPRKTGGFAPPREPAEKTDLTGDLAELSQGLELIVEDDRLATELLAGGVERGRLWLGIDPGTQSQSRLCRLAGCGGRLHLPLAATGKALMGEEDQHEVARLLAAIRVGATYDGLPAGQLPHRQATLRDPDRLGRQLAAFPQAVRNNSRLAERCAHYAFLPRRPVFPGFDPPDGLSVGAFLRRLCRYGLRRRYGDDPPQRAHRRLEKELRLVEKMGLSEYFLVVWDIVQYARRRAGPRSAPVTGRGSGGSSILAYLLGITNVCPLAFNIPFERFLHEGREDFPDLDVDFCWRIRDHVIEYAIRRWGGDRVAMVSTHNTFQPASAVRETAKAFGLSDRQVSRLAEAPAGRALDHERGGSIARLSRRIVGLPRNLSVHPGGIVIGRKPIDRYVPVQLAPKGVMITQYDKDGVEDVGLIKLDLLGNRNLSTVAHACDLLARRGGGRIEVESLPMADPPTLGTLQAGETVGCNQLESPAMRQLLKMLRPAHVRDVMKALALIRPGAASIGMKEAFIRRHRGLDPVPRGHRKVDAVLGDTHGVMLYEDDVMLVAAAMLAPGGSGLSEGDRFRKAVQKCRTDERRMELSREFLRRCAAGGIDPDYAKDIWVQMAKFNAYSFCRAHAAGYALLAYAGAYLKTHHPLEFWVASLNNNQSMYHPRVYVEQAKRAGIRFLLPDVNRSGEEFRIEGEAIRVGLNFIAGLGPAGVGAILQARRAAPFAGLTDCLRRTRLGREQSRDLILCGAFDFTAQVRPGLIMASDVFFGSRPQRLSRQLAMLPTEPAIPPVARDYTYARKYADERRVLGICVREHIMRRYRPGLRGAVDADSRQLHRRAGGRVRIAGVLEAGRTTTTRTGRTMKFLTMEDEYGLFEVSLFPRADAAHRGAGGHSAFNRYGPYLVTGTVENQYDSVTISAGSVSLHGVDRLRQHSSRSP